MTGLPRCYNFDSIHTTFQSSSLPFPLLLFTRVGESDTWRGDFWIYRHDKSDG